MYITPITAQTDGAWHRESAHALDRIVIHTSLSSKQNKQPPEKQQNRLLQPLPSPLLPTTEPYQTTLHLSQLYCTV